MIILSAGTWLFFSAFSANKSAVAVAMNPTYSRQVLIPLAGTALGVEPNGKGVASVDFVATVQDLGISTLKVEVWDKERGASASRSADSASVFSVQRGTAIGSYSLGDTGSLAEKERVYEFKMTDNRGFVQAQGHIVTRLTSGEKPTSGPIRSLEIIVGLLAVMMKIIEFAIEFRRSRLVAESESAPAAGATPVPDGSESRKPTEPRERQVSSRRGRSAGTTK
jgi:hypothetical protein